MYLIHNFDENLVKIDQTVSKILIFFVNCDIDISKDSWCMSLIAGRISVIFGENSVKIGHIILEI